MVRVSNRHLHNPDFLKGTMKTQSKWLVFPADSGALLKDCMDANILVFRMLADEKDFTAVKNFREGNEAAFKRLDEDYTVLCHDEHALITWADRMRAVRRHLDELDRNLAFEGKRQFNWDAVVTAIGILDAYRVMSEQTIALNKS